jgi:hypothetical protein
MAGCGCGNKQTNTVWLLEFPNGSRPAREYATKVDAEIANARVGGGGTVRPVHRQ